MNFRFRRWDISPWVQVGILVAITIAILYLRRPDQFLHPYIWVEDGKYILKEYARQGAWTLTTPLAGYLLTATKIISVIAYKTSILYAPEIELVLVVAFTCTVIIAVALSPTLLRWPFLCAVSVLLIPSESEVFAVSSYAFWWAGILPLLALVWDPDRGREKLRWLYIVFGGLSSPIIVPVTFLLGLRAVVERRVTEYYACGIGVGITIVQLLALRSQGFALESPARALLTLNLVPFIVQTHIGNFFYADHGSYIGYTALPLLILAGWSARSRLNCPFLLLVLTFLFVCVNVTARTGVGFNFALFQPIVLAPRYYFYPFIVLSEIMIWIAAVSVWPVRIGFLAAFAAALFFAQSLHVNGIGLSRRHDPFDWREQILACAKSDEYNLPIHYIGHANDMWYVTLTGQECIELLRQSIF